MAEEFQTQERVRQFEDDMGGFGYRENIARDTTNVDPNTAVRCACGGILLPPPTNYNPLAFLPLQPQAQLQEMTDAGEGQLAPDLPLPPDPTTVCGGGPDQSVCAAPRPQADSSMRSPEADLAPLQTSSPRIDAPVASVQQPADDRPLQPSSGGGDAGSSRRRRRYRRSRKSDRTVTLVPDGAPPTDTWAWRKYGQKAIKGSLYLRSYYKCSTDRNCRARKYVDRCIHGSRYLIVSYCDEHSHAMPLVRNSVNGGTSREMLPLPPSPSPLNVPAVEETRQDPAPSLTIASASLSPTTTPRPPSTELDLDVEDYRDTMAVTMMLKDDDKPQNSLQFPAPEELAAVHHSGELGSNNLPMPCEHAEGSSSNGDGSRMTAPVQDPVANVVNETFCRQPWDSLLDLV